MLLNLGKEVFSMFSFDAPDDRQPTQGKGHMRGMIALARRVDRD